MEFSNTFLTQEDGVCLCLEMLFRFAGPYPLALVSRGCQLGLSECTWGHLVVDRWFVPSEYRGASRYSVSTGDVCLNTVQMTDQPPSRLLSFSQDQPIALMREENIAELDSLTAKIEALRQRMDNRVESA